MEQEARSSERGAKSKGVSAKVQGAGSMEQIAQRASNANRKGSAACFGWARPCWSLRACRGRALPILREVEFSWWLKIHCGRRRQSLL